MKGGCTSNSYEWNKVGTNSMANSETIPSSEKSYFTSTGEGICNCEVKSKNVDAISERFEEFLKYRSKFRW